MTKREGEEEGERGRETQTCKTPRENKAERKATATFRAQDAIKFILNLPHDTVSVKTEKPGRKIWAQL